MAELAAEAALAQDIGRRARQEDAAIAHFSGAGSGGIAVLSDGMGGHDDGDLAARIIAAETFGELFLSSARRDLLRHDARAIMGAALGRANRRLQHHIDEGHLSGNTGGTLLSVIVADDGLRWISVGDSPLWLLRDGTLTRLNEVHSMGPQLDLMVAAGELDAVAARDHGGRGVLTSAVTGGRIARIDCPDAPMTLRAGDLVVLASDGVETLDSPALRDLLYRRRHAAPQAIADAVLRAVRLRGLADQDNASVVVIRMRPLRTARGPIAGRVRDRIADALARLSRVPEPHLPRAATEHRP